MRCLHESSLYDRNCFLTLTYEERHLPVRGQLSKSTMQKFFKRMRESVGPFRRLYCGEYGEESGRPHYHALIFGYDFPDKIKIKQLSSKCTVYRSALLDKLWPYGHTSVGALTFESAAYVARYCLKKVTGKGADDHYARSDEFGDYRQVEEFIHGSNRPGLGKPWLKKFKTDVYPNDYVVINGKEVKPPRYYDKIFSEENPTAFEWIQYERAMEALVHSHDNTPERLAVKETVTKARISQFKRNEHQ